MSFNPAYSPAPVPPKLDTLARLLSRCKALREDLGRITGAPAVEVQFGLYRPDSGRAPADHRVRHTGPGEPERYRIRSKH
jgi:hypothetical protein